MRICLVHRDLHAVTRGGIGTVYRELDRRLRHAGHDITLLTQQSRCPLNPPGADVLTLPRTENLNAHRRAVAEVLTQLRPDVVECSTWEAEALHYLRQPRAERAPVVVRGEFSAATMNATILVAAERELVRSANAVAAVSDYAARDLAAAYHVPIRVVIPNGVDRERFRPGPVWPPTSGHRITLDEGGAVDSRTPLADLTSAGDIPPPWAPANGRARLAWVGKITPMKGWDRLENLAVQLSHRANITVLLGHSRAFCPVTLRGDGDVTIVQDLDDTDMVSLYRAADWLISTSRWEGFGLAIAEAMACGTPVLLPADLGVAPELLAEGGGLTYQDVDHLATIPARSDKPSGRLPTRFDWDRNVAATLGLYHTVTGAVETR